MEPMTLSESRLHKLLDEAIRQVPSPAGCAAVLEGSIAEGFGNESSDVDFLLIDDSDRSFPGTPTVLFIDGRRVELRLRSTHDIEVDIETLLRMGGDRQHRLAGIPLALLNRCQRLTHAFPLAGHALVNSICTPLGEGVLERITAGVFSQLCRQYARHAVALYTLGETLQATNWMQTALAYGAKAWLATRGETYVEPKWLSQQLARARDGRRQIEAYRRLSSADASGLDATSYLDAAVKLLGEFDVDGCELDPRRLSFARCPEVTTWPINSRVHILCDRHEVYALSTDGAKVWRQIVFGKSLPAILEHIDTDPTIARRAIAAFYRLGLVDLRWNGSETISAPPRSALAPSVNRPILSMQGAVFPSETDTIKLLALSADRFATAGMALGWANVMIENAREDAVGAIGREQWGVVEAVARRMIRESCLAVLSTYGIDPLPAQEEACACLRTIPGLDGVLADAALELDRTIAVSSRADAESVLASVAQLVERTRALTGASDFPSSFVDADGWRATLETFYDWARIGAYLDSEFPLEDLRDVLVSTGDRRRPVLSATAKHTT